MVVVQVVLQGRLVSLSRLLVLQKHLLNPDLLQDSRELVVMEKVDHGVLWRRREGVAGSCEPVHETSTTVAFRF